MKLRYAIAAAAVLYAVPASAGTKDLRVVNKTGFEFRSVYAGPSSSQYWDPTCSRANGFPTRPSMPSTSPRFPTNACGTSRSSGEYQEFFQVDVCASKTLSFFTQGNEFTTRLEYE